MALVRWDPWRGMEDMRREMDRVFDRFFGRGLTPSRAQAQTLEAGAWVPSVDVVDKKDKIIARFELPGMSKEDIKISATEDTLTVRGESRQEKETKDEDYYLCERCYGSFSRTISLPVGVESDKVKALYRDGILEVTLPKAKEMLPREVEIEFK
jgi:HSP20 family protein